MVILFKVGTKTQVLAFSFRAGGFVTAISRPSRDMCRLEQLRYGVIKVINQRYGGNGQLVRK
jgi:hypothetical protein